MRQYIVVFLLLAFAAVAFPASHAGAQRYFSDHYYIPPPEEEPESTEKALRDRRYPLPEATARAWLARQNPRYVVEEVDVDSTEMKQFFDEAPPHQVAINRPINVEAAELFDGAVTDGGAQVYLAWLSSPGAYALRLRVNTMGLRPGERLWLLDAEGAATFGPYTVDNAKADGQWLPPTIGDAVALALTTPENTLPLMVVTDAAHFYKPIIAKELPPPLSCNIPIAQESNRTAQEITAGVGRMLIPYSNGQGLCTATLLNSFKTVSGAPAPYIISAWHCFGDDVNYDGLTVFWDYRSDTGNTNDVPDLYDSDYNTGAKLIDNSFVLDSALLELKSQVSVGPYGRAWAGWDSQAPGQADATQVIHHPLGADMKTSRGRITNPETNICMNLTCRLQYEKQIEVLWSDGVTEQGSSGSALLIKDNNYRIAGVLSNGNTHRCDDTSNNFDNFGPFHAFFPQIGCYLVNGYTCAPPYEPESSGCFLFRKMKLNVETLGHLRTFRDEVLGKSAFGRNIVQNYYLHTGELEQWIETGRYARPLFECLLSIGATWGALAQ